MVELKDYWLDKQSLADIAYCDMYTYIIKRIIAGYNVGDIEYKPANMIYVDKHSRTKEEISNTTIQVLGLNNTSLMAQTLDKNGLNILKLDIIASIIKQLINSNIIDILKYRRMSNLTLTSLGYTVYSKLLYTDSFNAVKGFKSYMGLLGSGHNLAPSYIGINNEIYCVKYDTLPNKDDAEDREIRLAQRLAQGYLVIKANKDKPFR